MFKRNLVKKIANTVVSYALAGAVTKSLTIAIPATRKYKAAEISGSIGGWILAEKLQPRVDAVIDNFFDRREARKA